MGKGAKKSKRKKAGKIDGTMIKRGLIGPTRLLTHVILFAVLFRSLSTDIVACKFVTGIGWFGGVYCD